MQSYFDQADKENIVNGNTTFEFNQDYLFFDQDVIIPFVAKPVLKKLTDTFLPDDSSEDCETIKQTLDENNSKVMSSSLNHLGCAYFLQEQKSKVSLKTGLNIITGYYRCPHYKERKDFKGCKARLIINAEIVLSKEHNSTNEDEIVRSFLVKKEHTCAKSHIRN